MTGNMYYLFFIPKGHSERHDRSNPHGFFRASEKTGQLQKSGTVAGARLGLGDTLEVNDDIMKKRVADLTAEQLQHILNIVETTCNGQGPSEDHKTMGKSANSGVTFVLKPCLHSVDLTV